MALQQNYIIDIPLEFKIACATDHFNPSDVLQAFIDHVCFFTTLSGDYEKGYKEATTVISEYTFKIDVKTTPSPAFLINREFAIKCVKQVAGLTVKKGISVSTKRKKSIPIVSQLYKSMDHHLSTDKIYLDEETLLSLSDDFGVICEFHQHSPKQYLEYFMSQISHADAHARIALNKVEENPSMGFYDLVLKGLGNLPKTATHYSEKEIDFIDSMNTWPYEYFIVRDLDKRRKIYQSLFKEYHGIHI